MPPIRPILAFKMVYSDYHLFILWIALILDWVIGDPDWLWGRIPHPVIWFGRLIAILDRSLNQAHYSDEARKNYGLACSLIIGLIAILAGFVIHQLGFIAEIIFAFSLFAGKSLIDHLKPILSALHTNNLVGARVAVGMIVGRKTDEMTASEVTGAAIESAAENLSDGVVAPIFWYAVGGMPLLLLYKMINTADSMIGYKNDRYLHFGYGVAKLDDLLNYIPARLTAGLILLAVSAKIAVMKRGWKMVKQDGRKHASPNAGMCEAAMAGVLNVRLGGPRRYGDILHSAPWINETGAADLIPRHLTDALVIVHSVITLLLLAVSFALLPWLFSYYL